MGRIVFLVLAMLHLAIASVGAQSVRDVYVAPRALFPFDPLTDRYERQSLPSVATYVKAWRDEGLDVRLHISTQNFSPGTTLYLSLVDSGLLNRVFASLDATICLDTTGCIISETIYDFPQSRDFLSSFAMDIERIKNFYSTPLCRFDSVLRYDAYAPSPMSRLMHDFQLSVSEADVSVFSPTKLNTSIDSIVYIRSVERLFPHDNQLVVVDMNGTELRTLIENIYGKRFFGLRNPQSDLLNVKLPPSMHTSIAGIAFSVNLTRPKTNRLEELRISQNKIYHIAMNSFTATKLGKPYTIIDSYKVLFIKYLRSNPKFTDKELWHLKPERWVGEIKLRENLQINNL